MNQNASFFVKLGPKVRCVLAPQVGGPWLLASRSSKEAPQAGPAGHTVPASCGQEPQKARPRLAWRGKRCSPVMGWLGACGKAHSFHAHAQQPCRGPWQVMVYREEGCAHYGDQESSMFRPSQTVPDRWVPQSWLLAH